MNYYGQSYEVLIQFYKLLENKIKAVATTTIIVHKQAPCTLFHVLHRIGFFQRNVLH